MKRIFIPLFLFLFLLNGTMQAQSTKIKKKNPYQLLAEKYLPEVRKSIARKHPRLFYSKALFEEFKRKAQEPLLKSRLEYLQKKTLQTYQELLSYTDKNNGLEEKLPAGSQWHPIGNFGIIAGRSAFFYHLTGEKKWAEISIDLMKRFSSYYRKRVALGRAVNWYGWGRIMHIMAWDYLYDVMTPADRDAIAGEILDHVKWLSNRKEVAKLCKVGEGLNSPGSGFYSAHCMVPWYAGIVFGNAGYEDSFAEQCLENG
ncbi:MAG: hypothetical protein J6S58_10280, partial [Lentisphaeria bacterium]|nr:hypothetical protein [Lentisphaeria bacterium]